jgi:hypothetical protein
LWDGAIGLHGDQFMRQAVVRASQQQVECHITALLQRLAGLLAMGNGALLRSLARVVDLRPEFRKAGRRAAADRQEQVIQTVRRRVRPNRDWQKL